MKVECSPVVIDLILDFANLKAVIILDKVSLEMDGTSHIK